MKTFIKNYLPIVLFFTLIGWQTDTFSQTTMIDGFCVTVDETGNVVNYPPEFNSRGSGIFPDWYYYPNTDWWNIWFFDGVFRPWNWKEVSISFTAYPYVLGIPSEILIVVNWSSQWWDDPTMPPLPPLTPEEEYLYVRRTDTLFYFIGTIDPVTGLVPDNPIYAFLYAYNPEWVSIDIWGENFVIPGYYDVELEEWFYDGVINHECWPNDDSWEYEFGDAPEHDLAYTDGIIGSFPTCIDNDPHFIRHGWPSTAFFGPMADPETDGNAGNCPIFHPNNYDQDECFQDGDAGLIKPMSYTITSDAAGDHYTLCPLGQAYTILQGPCQTAVWGQDIDIHVSTAGGGPAIVNVLFDWDHDGQWMGNSDCLGTPAPEHVLINFPIPANFNGPLSALGPPNFLVGPDEGYFWARFSIMEEPVPVDWDGHGQFADGETEDYLLRVEEDDDWLYEYGDAPEDDMAYIDGTIGNFPTCIDNDPFFIRHGWPSTVFFGPMSDAEPDGNAGNCPTWWQNQYDLDECFQDGDAGLILPMSYTITSDAAGDHYTLCPLGQAYTILQEPCKTAVWGQDIDIHVSTAGGGPAIVNVLCDWNHDGQWMGSSDCSGTPAPEHVLINFPIPANFNGPLSAVVPPPPNFLVGPDEGHFWARFSIMERAVPADWDGQGQFADGETEDYLLYVKEKRPPPIPLGTWSIILGFALITFFTAIIIRRRMV